MTDAEDIDQRLVLDAIRRADASAEPIARKFRERFPESGDACFLHGALLERIARFPEALAALDDALRLDAGNANAAIARALVLAKLNRSDEAAQSLTAALERNPRHALLWTNLGVLREQCADFEGALAAYDRALSLEQPPAAARLNRGHALCMMRRYEEALENNLAAVDEHREQAATHFNVAEVLLALDRYEEALAACDRALRIDPGYAKAQIERAFALAALGRLSEGQTELDRARANHPLETDRFLAAIAPDPRTVLETLDARSIYFHSAYERFERCDWAIHERFTEMVSGMIDEGTRRKTPLSDRAIPFRVFGLSVSSDRQHALAQGVAGAISRRVQRDFVRPRARVAQCRERIRIGYVSPDFRDHPTALLTRKLYALHDRSKFEVYAYALTGEDGSAIRTEIRRGCDVFRDLSTLDPGRAAATVRDDEIDVLVDLAGYTKFACPEIFALRPAPLQLGWLGYPGTLGAEWLDYVVVDPIVCPPGADRFWTERLVRLPDAYLVTDDAPYIADADLSRLEVGLPQNGFVFCCFNSAWKIEPRIFAVWMRLLKHLPDAVLWLLELRDGVARNLRREAEAHGVDPDRIVFGARWPNERHLLRYGLADLFLDTLTCNAHTTAVDALREGLPVLTLPGQSMPSRVAASLVSAAGISEMICTSLDHYEAEALALARSPERLARLRIKLRDNRAKAALFDTEGFIRKLELAYEMIWSRKLAGLSAQSLDVLQADSRSFRNNWF